MEKQRQVSDFSDLELAEILNATHERLKIEQINLMAINQEIAKRKNAKVTEKVVEAVPEKEA